DSTALNSEPSTGLSDSMSLMMGGSSETAVSPPLPPGGLMRIVWVFLVRIISSSITPASTVSRRESEHREARGSCTRTSSAELVAAAPRLPHTSSSPASGGRIKRHDAVCKTLADHLRAHVFSIKPIQLIYYHDNFTVKDTVDCTSAARCSQCR
ncbi:hypothetical protein PV326_000171, partial [Microctonus aethiopoides]